MTNWQQGSRISYAGQNVLVTGADGFIGSHLTELLVSRGAKVTALSLYNSFDSCGWLDDLNSETRDAITVVRGDIRDPVFVRRIVNEQQIVFHLAALIAIPYSYSATQSYVETNILGTLNVLEAARDAGVTRIVHTSTSEVYGTAVTMPITEAHPLQGQSPYSASKIGADMMVEAFARSFDLPAVILRPFNTYGPRQSERAIIPTVLRQALDPHCQSIMIGDTTPVRDFTFVEDTVAAFIAVGSAVGIDYGRPYNAGSGTAVTIGDLIELIVSLTECKKPIQKDPERSRPTNSEVRALLADSNRLTAHTGWAPSIGLKEGLGRTINHWTNRLSQRRVRNGTNFVV
jgi:UDP-glucose 4-epimerase